MEVMIGTPNLTNRPDFTQIVTALGSDNPSKNDLCAGNSFLSGYDLMFPLRVIKSDLSWLSAVEKDVVYDMASKRIAEKCGRTAMPEMNRKWVIPASNLHSKIEILLREPSLTGDNLGLKTWATSFAVSKQIGQLGRDYFSHLLSPQESIKNPIDHIGLQPKIQVLELGSGTGLLGMVAAAAWGVSVLSTDLEEIQENLRYNIQLNHGAISRVSNGSVSSQVLDWRMPEDAFLESKDFELIMATDPLYDNFHPLALANTINFYLKKNFSSRLLVSIPLRDNYTVKLSQELRRQLLLRHFQIVTVDQKLFQDNDWTGSKNDLEDSRIETTVWCRSKVDINDD